MDMPTALQECAELLEVASHALKRMSGFDAAQHSMSLETQQYLDEVSRIADRLGQLGALIGEASAKAAASDQTH